MVYHLPVTYRNRENRAVVVRAYLSGQRVGPYAAAVKTPALMRPERTTASLRATPNPTLQSAYANLLDTVPLAANATQTREYVLLHAGGCALPLGLFLQTRPQ